MRSSRPSCAVGWDSVGVFAAGAIDARGLIETRAWSKSSSELKEISVSWVLQKLCETIQV